MQTKIIYSDSSFSKTIVAIGYGLILLGVFLLFVGISGGDERISAPFYNIIIPIMLFVGIVFSFFKDKIKVDYKKQKIFIYSEILGLKFGSKTKLANYHYTTIVTKKLKNKNSKREGVHSSKMQLKSMKHDVLLLSKDHKNKRLLSKFDNFREARDFSRKIAETLKKPIVK